MLFMLINNIMLIIDYHNDHNKYSLLLQFTLECVSYTVPGTPTDLTISPPLVSCDKLVITWTAPPTTPGDLIVRHKVYINDKLRFPTRRKTTIPLKALTANTEYNVTVVAFNDVGDGGTVTGTGRTRPEGLIICYYISTF